MMQPRAPLSLVISNTIRLWAGAERFALDAARGLQDRGHAVAVEAYPDQPLYLRAKAAGLRVWGTRVRGDWTPWTLAAQITRLRRSGVALVWTMREKDLRNLGLAARLAHHGIAVIHSRECDEALKSKFYNRWFFLRVADRVVVNSEATRRTTRDSAPWLPEARIEFLPKGLELEPWESARAGDWPQRLGLREGEILVGFAGQLVTRKRVDRLLRCLARAPLRPRRWRLVIAGKGPEEARLRALSVELGISERVRFCGFLEDLTGWMAALDLFVLPSRVEGFGYVMAEAMAAGRPVLGFSASSVPEVVTHGESGLLVPDDDENAFTSTLLRLLDDQALRRRLGEGAREEARRRHSLDRMIDSMEEILYRAVAVRRGHSTRGVEQ